MTVSEQRRRIFIEGLRQTIIEYQAQQGLILQEHQAIQQPTTPTSDRLIGATAHTTP